MTVELIHGDCMDYMRECEDNAFDLAIVDPPYGIGADGGIWNAGGAEARRRRKVTGYKPEGTRTDKKEWDSGKPPPEYWRELLRVSEKQIVWGGNYFTDVLPVSRCWLCWDKKQPDGVKFSQHELAWTSFDSICLIFRMFPTHVAQGVKIHPTQKPIRLYDWLLTNYAKPGQRILDTHLGSGSSAIAAHYFGVDFVGIEIDEDYYNAACERFRMETAQQALL